MNPLLDKQFIRHLIKKNKHKTSIKHQRKHSAKNQTEHKEKSPYRYCVLALIPILSILFMCYFKITPIHMTMRNLMFLAFYITLVLLIAPIIIYGIKFSIYTGHSVLPYIGQPIPKTMLLKPRRFIKSIASLILAISILFTSLPIQVYADSGLSISAGGAPTNSGGGGGIGGTWDESMQGLRFTIVDNTGEPVATFGGKTSLDLLFSNKSLNNVNCFSVGCKTERVSNAVNSLTKLQKTNLVIYLSQLTGSTKEGDPYLKVELIDGKTGDNRNVGKLFGVNYPASIVAENNAVITAYQRIGRLKEQGNRPLEEINGTWRGNGARSGGKGVRYQLSGTDASMISPDGLLYLLLNLCKKSGEVYKPIVEFTGYKGYKTGGTFGVNDSIKCKDEKGNEVILPGSQVQAYAEDKTPAETLSKFGLSVIVEPIIWNRIRAKDGSKTFLSIYGTQVGIGVWLNYYITHKDLTTDFEYGGLDVDLFGHTGRKCMVTTIPYNFVKTIDKKEYKIIMNPMDSNRKTSVSNTEVLLMQNGWSAHVYTGRPGDIDIIPIPPIITWDEEDKPGAAPKQSTIPPDPTNPTKQPTYRIIKVYEDKDGNHIGTYLTENVKPKISIVDEPPTYKVVEWEHGSKYNPVTPTTPWDEAIKDVVPTRAGDAPSIVDITDPTNKSSDTTL